MSGISGAPSFAPFAKGGMYGGWPTLHQSQMLGCPILRAVCEGWDVRWRVAHPSPIPNARVPHPSPTPNARVPHPSRRLRRVGYTLAGGPLFANPKCSGAPSFAPFAKGGVRVLPEGAGGFSPLNKPNRI